MQVICIDEFKERKIANGWIDDFIAYSKQQWSDFSFKLSDGESLNEVQSRNIAALNRLLSAYPNETILIGTHGTALSTVVNYFDQTFTYDKFIHIVNLMPWIVHFEFDSDQCVSINFINLFTL